jgi:hypothetical protein
MTVFGTSAWLAIGPALIAGSIGLTSAVLSFVAAQRSLARAQQDAREQRDHQRRLLVWKRQLDAVETVWLLVFELEASGRMDETAQQKMMKSIVWLPDDAGRDVLALVNHYSAQPNGPHVDALKRARTTLLAVRRVL